MLNICQNTLESAHVNYGEDVYHCEFTGYNKYRI